MSELIEGEALATADNLATALNAGRDLAGIEPRITMLEHPEDEETSIPVFLIDGPDGAKVVPATEALAILDDRLPGPRRRRGVFRFTEVDALIAYTNRYSDANTLIYADTSALGFTVVLDDHAAGPATSGGIGYAAWRDHRATYGCPRSPEWIAWTALDGQPQTQEKFADFIESRLEDIASLDGFPRPTDVLTMARSLMVKTKGTFQKDFNPTNGDSILVCKTETDTGSTTIPRAFLLGIPVFENGDRYSVEARVRFGFIEGRPAFTFQLHRRKEIERDAFAAVRARIAAETGRLVLAGAA